MKSRERRRSERSGLSVCPERVEQFVTAALLRVLPSIHWKPMDPKDDDELEWMLSHQTEKRCLTSISPQCLEENCQACPGFFQHPDAGDEPVFCVHVCHKVSDVS
jgi:hypothetical protein